ncbi:hypothetical protein GGR53DRAFT_515914 [Hypoxylon sp. FL1150]|nr:hypothetical protein GGR53DRAFT_515914 [Hypoxylon sp. FL1150]
MLNLLCVELVELIARALDNRYELLVLRLVCRHLRRATSVLFTKAWFTTLTIDFTPRCLHRLSNIAQRDDLALAVRCLRVADCYRSPRIRPSSFRMLNRETLVFGEGLLWPRTADGILDLTSQPVNHFTELLARFRLCTEIRVTDEIGHPNDRSDTYLCPIDACYIMLNLLARHRDLYIQSFIIKFDRARDSKTTQMPTGLADLLVLSSWASHLHRLSITWTTDTDPIAASVTMDLIRMATCAQSLTLSLPHSMNENIYKLVSQAPQLPALTKLTLGKFDWPPPDMFPNIIARFRGSLKRLHVEGAFRSPGALNSFFGLLAGQNLTALESITVADGFGTFFCPFQFNQDALQQCGVIFEFTLRFSCGGERVNGIRYRGSRGGIRHALQILADTSYYQEGAGPPIPALMGMEGYKGDGFGRVVKRFT